MKLISFVKYTFALIGLGMLIGAFFAYRHTHDFLAEAISAQGTVVDMTESHSRDSSGHSSTYYYPVIEFKDQRGETIRFTSSSGSNPPSYSRGESADILYVPSRPQDASINGFFSLWGAAVILGGIGAIFFLTGGLIILFTLLKRRQDEALRTTGMPVSARFQSVEFNTTIRVNGRSPFVILAQWQNPATSEIHVFQSNNLWFDPSDYVTEDRPITVYIDRNNPKKYYVDLSFLPKLAD